MILRIIRLQIEYSIYSPNIMAYSSVGSLHAYIHHLSLSLSLSFIFSLSFFFPSISVSLLLPSAVRILIERLQWRLTCIEAVCCVISTVSGRCRWSPLPLSHSPTVADVIHRKSQNAICLNIHLMKFLKIIRAKCQNLKRKVRNFSPLRL